MDSFYVPEENIRDDALEITGEEYHHLVRVMRKKTGDTLLAVNGKGTAYKCVIEIIDTDAARCVIGDKIERYNEPVYELTVMLPVLKNHGRMEWLVEKGTEMGVGRFVPVRTERTVPHGIRYERLRKTALAAMKQCGRSFLPEITELVSFDDLLVVFKSGYDCVLFGDESLPAGETIGKVYERGDKGRRILLMAGPEGGFTGEESEQCRRHGGLPVSLGERRYRAETAALIMTAFFVNKGDF